MRYRILKTENLGEMSMIGANFFKLMAIGLIAFTGTIYAVEDRSDTSDNDDKEESSWDFDKNRPEAECTGHEYDKFGIPDRDK